MLDIQVDMSKLKSELTRIQNDAYTGVHMTDDNERRDLLLKLVEQIKALNNNIKAESVNVEIKPN